MNANCWDIVDGIESHGRLFLTQFSGTTFSGGLGIAVDLIGVSRPWQVLWPLEIKGPP